MYVIKIQYGSLTDEQVKLFNEGYTNFSLRSFGTIIIPMIADDIDSAEKEFNKKIKEMQQKG